MVGVVGEEVASQAPLDGPSWSLLHCHMLRGVCQASLEPRRGSGVGMRHPSE